MTKELRLGVNIYHVATIRNARGGAHPDPLRAAKMAAKAGADGITAHLREDRRHMTDNDIDRLSQAIDLPLNLEMAATDEMLAIRTVGADAPGKVIGARRQIEARQGHATYSRLPQLAMPVLICGGRHDGVAPVENQKALLRQISSARMALFEGGHLFFMQDPRAFEEIIAFLKEGNLIP